MRAIVRRLSPDTLGGRIILVLLVGLLVFHLGSQWLHQADIEDLLGTTRERHMGYGLAVAKRLLDETPVTLRDRTAHDLSAPSLDLHWAAASSANVADETSPTIDAARARLHELIPDVARSDLRLGYTDDDPIGHAHHRLVGALRLADGTWLNFSASLANPVAVHSAELLSTTVMAAGILLVALVVVRLIGRPLRALSDAADRIGGSPAAVLMPEQGPREVRHAARAFNLMQLRIDRMLTDRTQTLAAVSHDLRTPIARLRLRAGYIDDVELQRQIDADLDEMDAMIGSTLAYLRGDREDEPMRATDLAAILATLCDDASDAGKDARYVGPAQARITGRVVALKRAFANLIDNALHYGGAAMVCLSVTDPAIIVEIADTGPGIADADFDSAFEPFRRLDPARSGAGSGLGLTIARQVVLAHGGTIALANRAEGGLRVTVRLPSDPIRPKPHGLTGA